jgi:hypothetical protein
LASAFGKHRINLSELEEYTNWVDTPEFRLNKHNVCGVSVAAAADKKNEVGSNCNFDLAVPKKVRGVVKKKKSSREYLGYCEEDEVAANRELNERQSDEEWEHIFDYMPLMTRPQVDLMSTG